MAVRDLLVRLRSLVQLFDAAAPAGSSQVSAYVLDAGQARDTVVLSPMLTGPGAAAVGATGDKGAGAASTAASEKEASKYANLVRLADSTKCEVYVCFEGPLGAHLKMEVQKNIWRG